MRFQRTFEPTPQARENTPHRINSELQTFSKPNPKDVNACPLEKSACESRKNLCHGSISGHYGYIGAWSDLRCQFQFRRGSRTRLIQTGESSAPALESGDCDATTPSSVLGAVTARKSTSLTWSDLSNPAQASLFGAWSCDRTQLNESDFVWLEQSSADICLRCLELRPHASRRVCLGRT